MKLHTVVITYKRLDLTRRAIESYMATVTAPWSLVVIDNASDDGTREWLRDSGLQYVLLDENRYPGAACNVGWALAPDDATLLHRADNDFAFLPGWCDEVAERFGQRRLGQLGLRTDEEEQRCATNVGGNCVIRRELWDAGLRYDERPWPEYPPGFSEDSFMSPAVRAMGWRWGRVRRPCVLSLASGDWRDPYYRESYGARRIVPDPSDPTAPGTR